MPNINITARGSLNNKNTINNALQQFDVHLMLQFRYLDKRLKFSDIAPYMTQIYGGQNAHALIWTPTVYVANERTSAVMGSGVKDLLISINPYGMVILNTRYSMIFNLKEKNKNLVCLDEIE